MANCNIDRHILRYMEQVESGGIRACEEQKLLMDHLRRCFAEEDIYTDSEQLEHYLSLAKYFPFKQLFPWEEFVIALHLCTYWQETGAPRWPDILCLIGRGAGKDGLIGLEGMALTSPYNPVSGYDVDICANNESQSMRPVHDLVDALNNPKHIQKLKKHFYWTKEKVQGRKNRGIVTGHTNNPGGKDGLRSGIVIFNEIHQYPNVENLNVFTTGLGKKDHPRRAFFTTQGNVRDGPLDEFLATAETILRMDESDNGMLPFICRLDDEEEVHDPQNWQKANPSLPYLPVLMAETEKEYREWQKNPSQLSDFMTKRMNRPRGVRELEVTASENVTATNRELPDMKGWACTVGVDFASIGDWVAVNAHFRNGDLRYDVNHAWMCLRSKDLQRIKAPWQEWADRGLLTVVDEVEIPPAMIRQYISELMKEYTVKKIAMDKFRFALMKRELEKLGFDPDKRKNIRLIRPPDIYCVQPVIESCFANQCFAWGDNPVLRWAVRNTKLVRSGKKVRRDEEETDTGNFYYAKIDAKSRKTDPFMALVHSMVIEDVLPESGGQAFEGISVMVG